MSTDSENLIIPVLAEIKKGNIVFPHEDIDDVEIQRECCYSYILTQEQNNDSSDAFNCNNPLRLHNEWGTL